jgi:5-methylcytosine-specific restriction endonuclease McrA
MLLFHSKADVLENSRGEIHSVKRVFQVPSVIHLTYFVKRPHRERKLTKFEIFNRDKYTCQYCGKQTKELTLDHVIPRHRNGEHSWNNVVSACKNCNRRKGGRTPEEAGMRLLCPPSTPRHNGFYIPYHYFNSHAEWQKYIPE